MVVPVTPEKLSKAERKALKAQNKVAAAATLVVAAEAAVAPQDDVKKKEKKSKRKNEASLDSSVSPIATTVVVHSVDESVGEEKKQKKKKKDQQKDELKFDTTNNSSSDDVSAASLPTPPSDDLPKKEKKKKRKKDDAAEHSPNTSSANISCVSVEGDSLTEPESKRAKLDPATSNGKDVVDESSITKSIVGIDRSEAAIEGALENFKISDATKANLQARGVSYLFPVQASTYNDVYDGNDLIVRARTGTGKTLSFVIPVVEKLSLHESALANGRVPRVIVMVPTRELALQVAKEFETTCSGLLRVACVYGGTPYHKQEQMLYQGCDVVVGTPGRVMDFVEKGTLKLSGLKFVILDEVDRMLDMGFAETVEQILTSAYAGEEKPQTLLWSATLPPWVEQTAARFMSKNLKQIDLVGQDRVQTSTLVQHLAIKCGWQDRPATIANVLKVYSGQHGRSMVFCETKKEADELAVSEHIKVETHVMHGDIPQEKREMVLKGFREGRYKVLITTDVAARGLDIPEVDLVVQCSPPKDVDSYIHRAGRTGRAGKQGTCVCFYKYNQTWGLEQVERQAGIKFRRVGGPSNEDIVAAAADDAVKAIIEVSESSLSRFRVAAKTLIESRGAEDALAAALAAISGSASELKARSLLCSQEGFTTYLFRTNIEIHGKGYVWGALNRNLPTEVVEKIRGMTLTADKTGAVFDFPSDMDSVVTDRWTNGKFDSLEVATTLPDLESNEGGRGQNGRNAGGGSGGGGYFRGGRGFRGGGGRGRGGGFRGRGRNY